MKAISIRGSALTALIMIQCLSAMGQVKTVPCEEIRNDPNSYFYKDKIPPFENPNDTSSSYFNFGLTKIIAEKDTFVTNLKVFSYIHPGMSDENVRMLLKSLPYGTFGQAHLDAELQNTDDMIMLHTPGGVHKARMWSNLNSLKLKHFKKSKRFKISAYFPCDNSGKQPVVKRLTAEVTFCALQREKSIVNYSVKYLKYRRIPKYGFPREGIYGGTISMYENRVSQLKEVLKSEEIGIKEVTKQAKKYLRYESKAR